MVISDSYKSPGYFEDFLKLYDEWKPAFDESMARKEEVLFLNIMTFVDGFGWKGGVVAQENVVVSPVELGHGYRSKAKSLANVPLALSYSSLFTGTVDGKKGQDWLFEIYLDELWSFAKGRVFLTPEGKQIRVFAFLRYFPLDIPARKALMGLQQNCNGAYPCHFCMINQTALRCNPLFNVPRSESFLNGYKLDSDGNRQTLRPTSLSLKELSMSSISILSKFPSGISPSHFTMELMHLFYLNSLKLHFKFVIKSLSSGNKT